MAGKLGKFQTRSFTAFKPGVDNKNHLNSLLRRNPQKASDRMVRIQCSCNKTMASLLNSLPTKTFDTTDEYTWEIIGSSRRNIPLVEARDENGQVVTAASGNVGAGTARFHLVFAEDWFANGEYIVGNLNELYQFRIVKDPTFEGTNTVYEVELAGGNTEGIPAERLLKGERFSIEAAYVEQGLSRKVGDIRFAAPVSMRNEWSTVRIQHKVSGEMMDQKLEIGIPIVRTDANGKETETVETAWMHWVDWQLEWQFNEYKNNALLFGRSNRNANGEYMNFGVSGTAIKTGAGLFEQMEVFNTEYYNEFSLKKLEDALYKLSQAKNLSFSERNFVMKTGEGGARQFNDAVRNALSGWAAIPTDGNASIVQKTTSELHENALKVGYQFTQYLAPNGVKLTVEVDKGYDDDVRNKIPMPGKIGPAFSYRYDIFDLGTMDQPNIFKCAVKNQYDIRGYQWGLRNPFTGETENGNMSYDEDSAVIHKFSQLGICMLDPTRSMSLIPNVLLG